MSSNKLTPEQAWVHVKALCKDADHMENHEGYTTIRNHDGTIPDVVIEEGVIDWPEGMDRYPPKEEWRDAVWPDDWGKPAMFGDSKDDVKTAGTLCGRCNWSWMDEDGVRWIYCQVRVTDDPPTIQKCRKVEQEKAAEDIFPPKDELKPGWLLPPGWLRKSKLSEQVAEWPEEVKSLMHINDGLVQKPDDGRQPMATAPKDREVELLMGGDWMDGFYNEGLWWTKTRYGRCTGWDRGHQPTAWREPRQKT